MPNSRITNSGNADRLWLYNDGELALYGTEIQLRSNTRVVGNILANGYQLPTTPPASGTTVSGGYYLYVGILGAGATIS
jgi:hypothetical protein